MALSFRAYASGRVYAGKLIFPVCQSRHPVSARAGRFTYCRYSAELTGAFQRTPQMKVYVGLVLLTISDLATYLALHNSNDTHRLLDWAFGPHGVSLVSSRLSR